MIKPLLRTIPKLSGNIKLTCNLTDYHHVRHWDGSTVYEANIRYAKLLPLSSNTYQKKIDAGLLGSSWEFDVKKFYSVYSDIFYKDCFSFNPYEMLMLDESIEQKTRSTDFEYGVKRISFSKNGSQFALYAPIYIDKTDELPAYFLLNIKLSNNVYDINKKIKINISNDSKYHYLGRYLQRYVSQINNDVVFCQPLTKQASYYGVDVLHGGFTKIIDNAIERIYTVQNTIHNFDSMITQGFERNKIIMKQILPLAFCFEIDDFLNEQERYRYHNQKVEFSGAYYDKNNNEIPFYDFSIDYDEFHNPILKMSDESGALVWQDGEIDNIMDVGFPSLNECRYINYQYANKLTTNFCRWKLKYSDDEHPYIANMSWAFSKNQGSNYRYGQFPVSFQAMEGLCDYIKISNSNYQYNLIFPFSNSSQIYDNYDISLAKQYRSVQDEYCLNWFNVSNRIYNPQQLIQEDIWRDVDDKCVYYNGILYDLANIYNKKANAQKIDKFAMIVQPNPNVMTITDLQRLKFANYTLYRQSGNSVSNTNTNANDALLSSYFKNSKDSNYIYRNESWQKNKIYQDQLLTNRIYTYSSNNTGYFIDINDYDDLDYYELNKYFDSEEISNSITYVSNTYVQPVTQANVSAYFLAAYYGEMLTNPESEDILGYLELPIYKSKLLTYDSIYDNYKEGDPEFSKARNSYIIAVNDINGKSKWLKDNFTVRAFDEATDIFNHAYIQQPYNGMYYGYLYTGHHDYENVLYGNMFYTKHKFAKKSSFDPLLANDFEAEYLKTYIDTKRAADISNENLRYSYWNYDDIFDSNNYDSYGNIKNQYAYAAYLYKDANDFKQVIATYINTYLNEHLTGTEYEFKPICENNSTLYVKDVFTERTKTTSKFYGDRIPAKHNADDMDVLWSDIYNLNNVFDKYKHKQVILNNDNTRYFYTRFLNKEHIYYYYVELFKDENGRYKDYTEKIMVDKLHIASDTSVLTTETNRPLCKEIADDNSDWLVYDWFNTIFIKRKIWVYDDAVCNHPFVRLVYQNIFKYEDNKSTKTFMSWYTNVRYDSATDMFYMVDNPDDKFELVFKRIMYRVDSDLWDITNISKVDDDTSVVAEDTEYTKYKDIYFYRIQAGIEYDNKYGNIIKAKYYDTYSKVINEYDDVQEIDTCLIPLFDDIFAQPSTEASIYTHYILNNINVTFNELLQTNNYRYNKNDKNMMVEITDKERKEYAIDKTYDIYDETYSKLKVEYDDLGYKDWNFNTYIDPVTGIKYGFYIIEANFNNTSNSFLLTGIVDDSYVHNIKYIHYINGINIMENTEYITSIFKQVAPFINLKMLQQLENIDTIIYPGTYNIELYYSQSKASNLNSSTEIDIHKHQSKVKKLMLTRYMHAFTPLMQQTVNVKNVYRLKLKDVNMTMLNTGKYNSIGDCCIYKTDEHLDFAPEYRVYTASKDVSAIPHYNNLLRTFEPIEQKHFNSSYAINLETEFDISMNKKYKYAELEQIQTLEKTFELFKNHINANRKYKFSDITVLFLFKKYHVEYDTQSVGLTLDKSEKLYTCTYKFKLL